MRISDWSSDVCSSDLPALLLLPLLPPAVAQLLEAVGQAVRRRAIAFEAAAILFGKALLDDPHHRARVELAAFEDDLPVLAERLRYAVDRMFEQHVEHAARAHLDRRVPRGGEALDRKSTRLNSRP